MVGEVKSMEESSVGFSIRLRVGQSFTSRDREASAKARATNSEQIILWEPESRFS